MRYEKEMQELKEQRAAIKARISELTAEYKGTYKNSGWGSDSNYSQRIDALKGNLAGVNEALCFLAKFN